MAVDLKPNILIIDDTLEIARYCERFLGAEYSFRHVGSGRLAMAMLRDYPAGAILLDRDFSKAPPDQLLGPRDDVRNEGIHILRSLRCNHPNLPIIMVTGHRDLATAVAAAELKADFQAWEDIQAEPAILAARLRRALENGDIANCSSVAEFRKIGIIAESPRFQSALCALYKALPGRAPIMLLGPTGSGKDTLAYATHALSGDPKRPFVIVNVAALNSNLIEADLFGKELGAHNDAKWSPGFLRMAHGGTLFLDEIGELPLELQAKLLTVLDRSEIVPVGGVKSYRSEFRLITATSRDLVTLVERNQFRRDLFHRIAGHTFELPPLSERPQDIPALAHAFLRGTEAFRTGRIMGISLEAIQYMIKQPWPGNAREVMRIIEAACASAEHTIGIADIHEAILRSRSCGTPSAEPQGDQPVHREADGGAQDAVFAGNNHDEVTRVYYFYLKRRTGGNMQGSSRISVGHL